MKKPVNNNTWRHIDEPLKERIKKNTVTNVLFFVLTFPLMFILTPMILKFTGKEAYGIWALTGTILVFLEFMGLQTPTAVSIVVPKYDAKKQPAEINSIVNTLFVFYFISALVIGLAFAMFQDKIVAVFFKVSAPLVPLTYFIVTLSVYLFLFNFVLLSFAYLLGGFNIFYPGNILHIIIGYLRAGLMIAALFAGYGIKGIVLAQMGTIILETALLLVWLKVVFPPLVFNPFLFSIERLKGLLGMSVKLLFTRLAVAVNYNVDKLVLGYLLNPVMVAYYQIGANVTRYISTVPDMMSTASLIPAASELKVKKEHAKIESLYTRINKYIFLAAIFLMAGIIIFGKEFLGLWLGPGYEDAYLVMLFLSVAYTYSLLGVPAMHILNGLEKINVPMVISFISAGLNILLSFILAKNFGLKGALIGTSIAIFIGATAMYIAFRKLTGIKLNIFSVFITPGLAVVAGFAVIYFMDLFYKLPSNWGFFFLKTGIFTAAFLVADLKFLNHLDWYDYSLIKSYLPFKRK